MIHSKEIAKSSIDDYVEYLENHEEKDKKTSRTELPDYATYLTENKEQAIGRTKIHSSSPAFLEALGLPSDSQEISTADVRTLASGLSLTGKKLTPKAKTGATDFVFSLPKSVSLLHSYALNSGDDALATALTAAFETAINETITEVSQTIPTARKMTNGRKKETTGDFVWSTNLHLTSRGTDPEIVGQPNLHAHVLLYNLVQTSDGNVSGLHYFNLRTGTSIRNMRSIFDVKMVEALHNLGYETQKRELGDKHKWNSFELEGTDTKLLEAFSARTQQIKEATERKEKALGRPLSRKEIETLARQIKLPKKHLTDEEFKEASLYMLGQGDYTPPKRHSKPIKHELDTVTRTAIAQQVLDELQTKVLDNKSVFYGNELEAYVNDVMLAYQLNDRDRKDLQDFVKASPEIQLLAEPDDSHPFGIYTTRKVLIAEQKLDKRFQNYKKNAIFANGENAEKRLTEWEKASGLTLNESQKTAVLDLLSNGKFVLTGPAGTGKTTTLKAIVDTLEPDGYNFVGVSLSQKATDEIAKSTKIPTLNIAKFIKSVETQGDTIFSNGEKVVLSPKTVLIVDECSLVDTLTLERLTHETEKLGIQHVLFVGDSKQLSAISSGTWFARAETNYNAQTILTENVRQANSEREKELTEMARDGRIKEYLLAKNADGDLHVDSEEELIDDLAKSYAAKIKSGQEAQSLLVVADTNDSVQKLNEAITSQLREEGIITDDKKFSNGERVMLTEQLKRKEVVLDADGNPVRYANRDVKKKTITYARNLSGSLI